AGGDVIKLLAIKRLPIREGAVGVVWSDAFVADVIEDLRLAVVEAGEGDRARAAAQLETGVPFGASGLIGVAVGENDFELAGIDDETARERPLRKIEIIIGQVKIVEADRVGVGIVKFEPRATLSGA